MRRAANNLMSKMLFLLFIIVMIKETCTLIATDAGYQAGFSDCLSALPFAQPVAHALCNRMDVQLLAPIESNTNVVLDLLKLIGMAFLQPIFVGLLVAVSGRSYSRSGHRIKEMVISLCSMPFLAIFIAAQANRFFACFVQSLGIFGAFVTSLVIVLLLAAGYYALTMNSYNGTPYMSAHTKRIIYSFLGKIVSVMFTSVLCIAVYISFVGGGESELASSVLMLAVTLVMMECGFKLMLDGVLR